MIKFGTDGVRTAAELLTDAVLERVAYAAFSTGKRHALIGRDTRPSGERIAMTLADRLRDAGLTVGLAGVLTTPALAYMTAHTSDCVGLMVSASHNPASDNGIKFFNGRGEKPTEQEEEALGRALACDEKLPRRLGGGIYDASQRTEEYLDALVHRFDGVLQGKHVVVDGANGGGSFLAPRLLRALGAEVRTLYCDGNGTVINLRSGATCPETLSGALRKGEIGFALDGDGDRCVGACNGVIYDGDDLLYLSALRLQAAGTLTGNTVVGTVMTNTGLERALEEKGIRLERVRVGDKYIARRMAQKGYVLGGESSGHLIFSRCLPTGDGLVSGVVFAASAPGVRYTPYPQVHRTLPADERTKERVNALIPPEWREGGGRVIVRPSGTEPKIRITAECPDRAQAEALASAVAVRVGNLAGIREDGLCV